MEKGTIVEYIDRQRMICGVVLESTPVGDKRLHLYTENNRAVNLPERRITFAGGRLDTGLSRQQMADRLKETAARRNTLMAQIDVQALWDLVSTEEQWISLATLKELCFTGQTSADHESAVVRAMFEDSLYFKFDHNRFFPHSPEQIKAISIRKEKEEKIRRIINDGSQWLKKVLIGGPVTLTDEEKDYVDILKDYYVFEQDAPDKALAREMLTRAGGVSRDAIFSLMVRLGVWEANENIDLYRNGVPTAWPTEVVSRAGDISRTRAGFVNGSDRVDLTDLPVFTIDGSTTTDFDDALSIEMEADGHCRVGVHIIDVGRYIEKNDPIDREALVRGSSIYTADRKIPMLPPVLSEDACSLMAGVERPAISVLMRFSLFGELLGYEIVPAIIRVDRHLSYSEADRTIDQDARLKKIKELTGHLSRRRLQAGALPIIIPDLIIQFIDKDRVTVSCMDNVSPSRMMVAEMMITANRLFAEFLSVHHVPAPFRSQAEPKQRLVKKADAPGSLVQNWLQRKMIARVVVGIEPDHHAGLGLEAYTTATSPIRKYLDLITQRQIRSILGLETPYTPAEVQGLLQELEPRLSSVARIQQGRQRYWTLKYLETKIGAKEEAVVLDSFSNDYSVLLPDYLLECRLPKTSGTKIKPQDLVQVTIQHVSARNNTISIFFG